MRRDWRRPERLAVAAVATVRRALSRDPSVDAVRALARARRRRNLAARRTLARFLRTGQRLSLPCAEDPEITVVCVAYGRAELTLACLRSLQSLTLPAEVLVVDNASPDGTGAMLDRLDGATVTRNETNVGFLRAAHDAAQRARGRAILFVNSDVEVMPGSIEAARRALDECGAGAVGGKLVLPDGSLQEAGAIVLPDGSTSGVGRSGDPDAAEYQFRRPVDYCSGAFLLVRREAWDAVEGFDDRYAPAYYEDADLCLRLWEAGWPVVYEPQAVARHYEFGSSSSSEAVALMQANRARFVPRHQAFLDGLPAIGTESHPHLRRSGARRVLVIEDRVPHVDLGSGFPRSLRLVEAMVASGWFVTLYPRHPVDDAASAYRSLPREVEVMLGWDIAYLARFLAARQGCYEVVVVCRSHNLSDVHAALGDAPGILGGARLVYDAEAVTAVREVAAAQLAGEAVADARARIDAELRLAEQADTVIAVSERESRSFREALPSTPVAVLSHAVRIQPTSTPFADRRDLLFAGPLLDDGTPNSDAVVWFAREVMPRLRAAMGPDAPRLVVVGRIGDGVSAITAPGVHLVGPVADLRPFYESARLLVAPTRFAAGVPIKVYEAAAQGLPVVTTDLLAEQLGWVDGHALRSVPVSDADAFARACIELYSDEERWQATRDAALALVAEECDVERFRQRVSDLLDGVGDPHQHPGALRP